MKIGGIITTMLVLGVIGLIVGYYIYGRVSGEYVSIETIFRSPDGLIDQAVYTLGDIESIRQKIIISGVVGLVIGLIIGVIRKSKNSESF